MNRIGRICYFVLMIFFGLFFLNQTAFAQQQSDVFFTLSPEQPEAFEEVTVRLESFLVDLQRATIAWSVNGVPTITETGETTFSTRLGDTGTTITIGVDVRAGGRSVFKTSIQLTPQVIDLLWEVEDAAAPPFYKGKKLPVAQSTVLFSPIKNGTNNGLIYNWKQREKVNLKQSGFNKRVFTAEHTILDNEAEVSVQVSNQDGSYNANSYTKASFVEPEVVFYPSDFNSIDFNSAYSTTDFVTDSIVTVYAQPYYLSKGAFSYNWRVNGESVDTTNNRITVSSRNENGRIQLEATVKAVQNLLQEARNIVTLVF